MLRFHGKNEPFILENASNLTHLFLMTILTRKLNKIFRLNLSYKNSCGKFDAFLKGNDPWSFPERISLSNFFLDDLLKNQHLNWQVWKRRKQLSQRKASQTWSHLSWLTKGKRLNSAAPVVTHHHYIFLKRYWLTLAFASSLSISWVWIYH